MNQRLWLLLVPLLVSVGALSVLLAAIEFDPLTIIELGRRLSLRGGLLLVALFVAQQVVRAVRLQAILPQTGGFSRALEVVLWHQFCAQMLPFHTGELSLPELLARQGVPRSESLGVMVAMRASDLLASVMLLSLGWTALPGAAELLGRFASPVLRVAVGLLVVLLVTLLVLRRWTRDLERSAALLPATSWRPHAARFVRILAKLSRGQAAVVLVYSTAVGVCGVTFSFLFCREFVPQLDWQATLLVVLLMPLLGQIPLRGFAGIGTTEAYLVVLFSLAGLPAGSALALAVCGRVFHLGLMAAGALLAFALHGVRRWRSSTASTQAGTQFAFIEGAHCTDGDNPGESVFQIE